MRIIPKFKIDKLPYKDNFIRNVFKMNQLVLGPHVKFFENGLSKCFNYKYANTTSSGYAAIFLTLKSLELKKARIVVPLVSTCQSITNAVLANGFEVVFCKIDSKHLSLSEDHLEEIFQKKPFDVIIAPSHFGIPAPIKSYRKYGVPIIEDACQAFLTRTKIKSSADFVILSFYPTKHFNCIEGGAILHNYPEKDKIIKDLTYYNQQHIYDGKSRFNLRLPNLHAAFGCILLKNLDSDYNIFIKIRDNYIRGIINSNILLPSQIEPGVIPWRFLINSKNSLLVENFKLSNIQIDKEMINLNKRIITRTHKQWFDDYHSIPFYKSISQKDQNFVINKINKI